MITVKWQQRSDLLNINLYQVNYKNIFDLNCWLIIISKMLAQFIAFSVTNRLYTPNLTQCFSNHGSRPKSGSPRLCGWIAKACKLPHVKEKDLRTQDFKSEEPS